MLSISPKVRRQQACFDATPDFTSIPDLFKLSSVSLTLLIATILVSILVSDLSPNKLIENLCQLVTVENVIKLWSTFYHQTSLLKHKCYNFLASCWLEYILPVFHHWQIKALEVKLQLLQAKIRAAEKRYEQDQQRCDSRSDEMKGITQLLQILQDTVYELSTQQEKDCTTCDNRYKSLQKLQEEKLLALQITLTSLCTSGERLKEEQKRIDQASIYSV